jgi:hypothetical protein
MLVQVMGLVFVSWHEISVKNTSPKYATTGTIEAGTFTVHSVVNVFAHTLVAE